VRVLAVDPGEKRIGLAISDPTGTIANPLSVIKHISRALDAAVIAGIANENAVDLIIVGQALDENGEVGFRARQAQRIAEAIREQTTRPVKLWDESSSTQAARQARFDMGVRRRKRVGHMDDLAAVVILQDYLDAYENKR
jgi:putative Holliday junction resolvase